MDAVSEGLDHVVLKTRSVDALNAFRQSMESAGFRFAPRLDAGSLLSDRIIFGHSYLAIVAIADRERLLGEGAWHLAAAPEGIAKVFYVAKDAGAAAVQLSERGAPVLLWHFAVAVELDEHPGNPLDTHHRILELDSLAYDTLRFALCQHMHPEVLFRADWSDHANGSLDIEGLICSAAEPARLATRYATLFGDAADESTDTRLVFRTVRDTVRILTTDVISRDYPTLEVIPRTTPQAHVVRIVVRDLAAQRHTLEQAGLAAQETAEGVLVRPLGLSNAALEFVADAR